MMLSVCIDMMFSYCDFYERFSEVKKCGINTIEFWKWTNKDIDRIVESGMDVSIFNIDSTDEITSTDPRDWKTGTRKITVGCDDGDGSGCTRETYSKTFRGTLNEGEIIITDEAGNTTPCKVRVKIDNTAPKCTVSGGNASWINATTTAQKRTITAKCDDGKDEKGKPQSGCKVVTQTKDYSTNIDTKTAGVIGVGNGGYVEDIVGNRTNCQANQTVKIDKNPPSCSVSGGSTSWINATSSPTKRRITATCTDTGGSGCAVAKY